ncbi:MAG: fused MFS/spermidine synthase [Myxococcales bacterium]|nr:fused MFS/spermidine synthase [Myxococcales bacterium]
MVALLLLDAFVAAAAIMALEILGARYAGPVFGTGIFVWSALLAVTLSALALGYALAGRLAARSSGGRLLGLALLAAGAAIAIIPLTASAVLLSCIPLGPRIGPFVAIASLIGPPLVPLGGVAVLATAIRVEQQSIPPGRAIGSLYAISTLGSLVGTLTTGLWLVPSFSVHSICWGLSGFTIIFGTLSVGIRWPPLATALLLAICTSWPATRPLEIGNFVILESQPTHFGKLEVIKDRARDLKLLRLDHSIIGGSFSDGSPVFAFVHLLSSAASLRPEASSALIIGLGSGGVVKPLIARGLRLHIIEINPQVVRMARRHFGFPDLPVTVADARVAVREQSARHDLIFHDAFSGGSSPSHLLSSEAIGELKARLSDQGLLALNFVGFPLGEDTRALTSVHATLRAHFSNVRAFQDHPPRPGEPTLSNVVFFATDGKIETDLIAHSKGASEHEARILKSMPAWEISPRAGSVNTDELNQLDWQQTSIAEAHFRAMNELLPPQVWAL